MERPGHDGSVLLPDGRILEYWDGGDPTGRAMLVHPGTPETRVMGLCGHDAAVDAGVRLVSVNRPGYGGSTAVTVPSLSSVGRDIAALAAHLGLDEYAVFGLSGGGPFAVATVVADPIHVRALGIVGGIGPWRILEDGSRDPEGSRCLDLIDAGDVAGAWDCMRRDVDRAYVGFGELDDDARVDTILARIDAESDLFRDASYRAIWAENIRVVMDSPDGVTFDNLAWGARWDVDPSDVAAPTLLWYGGSDQPCPPAHGLWYADRIAGSELVMISGARHLEVIDGHWPEVLAGLLSIWKA